MSKKQIPVEESLEAWRKDPAYRAAFDALDDEFSLTAALIDARGQTSQEEVAKRMRASQPNVARLEGGKGNPSINTLRRYADATARGSRSASSRRGRPRAGH